MSATLTMAPAIRFHLSLNVSNLPRSVQFYRTLFGRPAAKERPDYAKFELDDPPLVLSLEPMPGGRGGALNHLGFRLPDSAHLVAMQERLERAGIRSQREEGVECCYARQTKFWVTDPDDTLWELYVLEGDLEHRGAGQTREEMLASQAPPPHPQPLSPEGRGEKEGEPVVWEHVLVQPVPERVPLADGTAGEVRLRGSFNVPLDDATRRHLLREAQRVLRPGGKLFVHTLVAERPLKGKPQLPGPAAYVQHVPPEGELPKLVEAAGFEGVELAKYGAAPCFVHEDVPLREMQLVAWKPATPGGAASQAVLYKGPFRQVVDDAGTVYPRGERVTIDAARSDLLRRGPLVDHFVFFGTGVNRLS